MNWTEAEVVLSGLLDAFDQDEHGDYFYDRGCEVCEALILAMSAFDAQTLGALQKQVPMKPVRKYRKYYSDDYCPVCGKQQKTTKRRICKPWYCERCGQKLSWEVSYG